jgi:hypothetical protein
MRPLPFLAAALSLAACDNISHVEMAPKGATVDRKGATLQLRAKAITRNGLQKPDVFWKWTSKDPKVATVSDQGLLTAIDDGMVTVTAATAEHQADLQVEVRTVKSLEIQPPEIKLVEDGERLKPKIKVLDGSGRELESRKAFARSADEKVANVDGEGGVWPVGAGETTLTVSIDGLEKKVKVVVAAAPKAGKKK